MFAEAGTTDYSTLVNTCRGLRAAARWIMEMDLLQQFRFAREMLTVDREQEADRRDGEEVD